MYCNKWNLPVNTSKTKVIIFNKGGYKISRFNFTLGDSEIDVVQDYTYLGILFSSSGSFAKACKALCDKASKAFFKLRQLDSRNGVVRALKLFYTLVKSPLYSDMVLQCEVLLSSKNHQKILRKYVTLQFRKKINVKLCKHLLGTGKYSVNDAVRGN